MDFFLRSGQLLNYASSNYFIELYFNFSYLAKELFLAARVFSFKNGLFDIIGVFSWQVISLFSTIKVLVSRKKLDALSAIPNYLFILMFI